jgi:hypothetical protein
MCGKCINHGQRKQILKTIYNFSYCMFLNAGVITAPRPNANMTIQKKSSLQNSFCFVGEKKNTHTFIVRRHIIKIIKS